MILANRSVAVRPLLGRFLRFSSGSSSKTTTDNNDPDLRVIHKELTLKLPSRRLDAVLKRTAGVTTTSLEKSFATNCVRVNEVIQKKKAYNVSTDDEIELWLAPVVANPEMARVHRVEIVDYTLGEHNYEILVNVDKSYIVKNWRHSGGMPDSS